MSAGAAGPLDGGAPAPPSGVWASRRLGIAGLALLVLGLILGGMALAGLLGNETPPGNSAGAAMTLHQNPKGGYSFSYPSRWTLKDRGAISTVTAPDSQRIVSFGGAPKGSLRQSSRDFLARIVKSYEAPVLSGAELQQVDGRRALAVAGRARNSNGVSIRFLAVTVAGGDRNYGIVVYTNASAAPEDTLPEMQAIVDSFRIES